MGNCRATGKPLKWWNPPDSCYNRHLINCWFYFITKCIYKSPGIIFNLFSWQSSLMPFPPARDSCYIWIYLDEFQVSKELLPSCKRETHSLCFSKTSPGITFFPLTTIKKHCLGRVKGRETDGSPGVDLMGVRGLAWNVNSLKSLQLESFSCLPRRPPSCSHQLWTGNHST